MTAPDALFWVGQKAFIEKDGKLLVLHDPKEGLDFPGGKIQEGEAVSGDYLSLVSALKREVLEEVGLAIEVGEPFAVGYQEFSPNHKNYGHGVYLTAFRCKYVSGEIALSNEHDNWRWVDETDYMDVDDGTTYFRFVKEYFRK